MIFLLSTLYGIVVKKAKSGNTAVSLSESRSPLPPLLSSLAHSVTLALALSPFCMIHAMPSLDGLSRAEKGGKKTGDSDCYWRRRLTMQLIPMMCG